MAGSGVYPLSVVVVGASGDLAKKKIYPALFSLFSQGLLPENVNFYGFARSAMSDEEFRDEIQGQLPCRYIPNSTECDAARADFLSRCYYVRGNYDSVESYLDLYQKMSPIERGGVADRIYYMAIPPFLFLDVARAIAGAGLVNCGEKREGFSRVVVEKPFGSDRASSDELVGNIALLFNEDQTYRIDHYLGKEVVQNLIVLRFANRIFEPIWNRMHISSVQVSFHEDFGVEGRAGYFDKYGIIRDIMQNHLLQIIALVAMEQPKYLDARDIRDEKVNVLRHMEVLKSSDFVLGQYVKTEINGRLLSGYLDDEGVPPDSVTPTFAQVVMKIKNDRWDGVPFVMTAGKALAQRMTEIRIRFRPVARNIFSGKNDSLPPNELVIRVQPDEAVYLHLISKTPGPEMQLAERNLNLRYRSAYDLVLPEAYESLLLDVVGGDKSLFIREDELQAAWDLFTPALHDMEEHRMQPSPYAYGSQGPEAAHAQVEAIFGNGADHD